MPFIEINSSSFYNFDSTKSINRWKVTGVFFNPNSIESVITWRVVNACMYMLINVQFYWYRGYLYLLTSLAKSN